MNTQDVYEMAKKTVAAYEELLLASPVPEKADVAAEVDAAVADLVVKATAYLSEHASDPRAFARLLHVVDRAILSARNSKTIVPKLVELR